MYRYLEEQRRVNISATDPAEIWTQPITVGHSKERLYRVVTSSWSVSRMALGTSLLLAVTVRGQLPASVTAQCCLTCRVVSRCLPVANFNTLWNRTHKLSSTVHVCFSGNFAGLPCPCPLGECCQKSLLFICLSVRYASRPKLRNRFGLNFAQQPDTASRILVTIAPGVPPGETITPVVPPGETITPGVPPGETITPGVPPGETITPGSHQARRSPQGSHQGSWKCGFLKLTVLLFGSRHYENGCQGDIHLWRSHNFSKIWLSPPPCPHEMHPH